MWQVDLTVLDMGGSAVLSSDELERAGRLRFDRDRRRYLAAHLALRQLLARHCGVAPAALVFAAGAHGKPLLTSRPSLGFNLSYAGDTAIIGIADNAEIGVDIGAPQEVDDDGLASDVLTPSEYADYTAAPPGLSRQRSFMTAWTRKEACLKALGTGLSVDPSTFEAGTDRSVRSIVIGADVARSVQVGSFEVGLCFGAWARSAGTSDGEALPTVR